MSSRSEFVAMTGKHWPAAAFVDIDKLPEIEGATPHPTIIGLVEDTRAESIRTLVTYPWLSHLCSATILESPQAQRYLATLLDRLDYGPPQNTFGANGVGRVALLSSSTRREARFERMREFFATQGVSPRAISSCSDIAEELVTNALYDAPVEAGYFETAVPRTKDIELPPEHACEISYGIEHGNVFIRVRDPFGALLRSRLLGVLKRCTADGVSLDESRGGAGLGLWRIFSTASIVEITVSPGSLTDIIAHVEMKKPRSPVRPLLAVHLYFPQAQTVAGAHGRFAAEHDHDLMDDSFTGLYAS